jgi:3-phenylpropionate/trans-cinnamate dioxygenase ferredoxin subunit
MASSEEEDYVKVAKVSDVKEGSLKRVELEDGEGVVIANVGGEYFAINATCHHEEWDLSEGMLEGHTIVCAGHGAEWNLETGNAKFDEPLEPEPLYGVKVEGEDILITRQPLKK